MLRRGPAAWSARPSSITPKTNATTPAACPNPRRNGAAMTAGAATVWMAACAPKGIVVRDLLIRQADYERVCDLSVRGVTQLIGPRCPLQRDRHPLSGCGLR